MDFELAGKVAIVTGSTSNIGRAIALDFAAEGASVVITGRDAEAGARVVALALERGAPNAVFVAAEMRDPESPARILAAAGAIGPVGVLVNNAGGGGYPALFINSDPANWQDDIDVNLLSVLRMTHAVLPGMIARKWGRIISIGSMSGFVGDYLQPIYSAAKGGVHSFTVALAGEVGQHGITVNAVAPYGTMSTDPTAFSKASKYYPGSTWLEEKLAGIPPEDRAKRARKGVLTRPIARPEEVSGAVLYLASGRGEFTTGQIIKVEGGTSLTL